MNKRKHDHKKQKKMAKRQVDKMAKMKRPQKEETKKSRRSDSSGIRNVPIHYSLLVIYRHPVFSHSLSLFFIISLPIFQSVDIHIFPLSLSYLILSYLFHFISSVNKPNLPCGFVPTRNGFPSPRVRAEAKGPARRVAAGCGAGEGVLLWGN